MYSPAKQGRSKEYDRQKIKDQKKAQLALLLVNKFRNKFNVITTTEGRVD